MSHVNQLIVTSVLYFTNMCCVFFLIAADCGRPLLLHIGAVVLLVSTLFSVHRHQEEGKAVHTHCPKVFCHCWYTSNIWSACWCAFTLCLQVFLLMCEIAKHCLGKKDKHLFSKQKLDFHSNSHEVV